MRHIASAFLVVSLLVGVVPAVSHAQTSTTISADIQAKIDLIANLAKQVQVLQQQILALRSQQQQVVGQLVSSLKQGSQGDQVKTLQALLAADPTIYPEGLITGYFGSATTRAVKRFQSKNGIDQAGNVGPKTLKKLNELFSDTKISFESENENDGEGHASMASSTGRPCVIVPPGHLIAPGWLRKHEDDRPIVPPCQILPPGIDKQIDHPTSTPTSTVDVTAPVISGVVTSVTTSSVTVTWTTNEPASSQVMYGLSTAYGSSTVLDSALVNTHSKTFTGLLAGTVYHLQIQSRDGSGNLGVSSDQIVTTSVISTTDTTPPTITGIGASFGTSTATITWSTNEGATSQVNYGANSSYGSSTTMDATLVTSHSQNLTGLMPGVTYHFQVVSKDSTGNTATSSDLTFPTNPLTDITPPVITAITLTPSSTTASIAWTTDEPASSKIFYGTTTPVNIASTSTLSVSDTSLVTSHNLSLSGLTASTTYHYVVQSADSLGNTATATEQSFVTTL